MWASVMACSYDYPVYFRPRAATGGPHQDGADSGSGVVMLGAAEFVGAVVVRDGLVCLRVGFVDRSAVVSWSGLVALVSLSRWFGRK